MFGKEDVDDGEVGHGIARMSPRTEVPKTET